MPYPLYNFFCNLQEISYGAEKDKLNSSYDEERSQ